MRIYLESYKHPAISIDYNNQDVFTPYEAENMDYIYEQILYRNKLLLDADGETFQIWRKKRTGLQCDNPNCGASQNLNGTPNSKCARCLGTGYIGGYDYAGETLIRMAPVGLIFTITPNGQMKTHNPKIWTFPEPEIYSLDILIALDQARIINEKRTVDKEIIRRVDISENYDYLDDTGITKILKIADKTNSFDNYQESIDFELSNDGILWKTGTGTKRPDDLESYFVTYITAKTYLRRYEVSDVVRSTWRSKILHQELQLNELELSHVVYDNINIEDWDDSRFLNPFPYSNWVERG